VPVKPPFGAIDINEQDYSGVSTFQVALTNAFKTSGFLTEGEAIPFDILTLSGGGSRGAFGAGLLCGWSEAGTRPDFEIVTGVSTGALQSTFAFLGSEYDPILREVYTQHGSPSIYRPRSGIGSLVSDAANDTWPLWGLIEEHITNEVLEAVAEKHRQGYRLFVGTTNLDTTEFIIWDMGKIAASDRPDKREHYCKVLLASSSVPALFPPVYFEVEADGKTYYEMHVDGGTYANVCFRGFMLEFEDAMEGAGLTPDDFDADLYIIRNGRRDEESQRDPVAGRTISIASATIRALFKLSSTSALYRLYVLAKRNDIEFKLATIPVDYEFDFAVTEFDREGMQALFDFGFEQASDGGYEWAHEPPFIDEDEVIK
jgi:predicted acylesterase/phospholipase RssA